MVAVRASHCLGKLVPLLPPESPLRAGSRATATVGREAAAWRAVADTSGAGAHPAVWELAWPTIVSNLLFSASGFIDIKIVGSLGASAVAAITTGTRIFFTAQAVLMAILAGTTALVARAWGAGHRDEAAQIAELSLWLCLVVSALLTLGGTLGADALAGLFRLEPQTVALAATFTRWLSVFYMAFAAVIALYGTAPYAAYGIGVNLLSFSFVVGFGFSVAASTVVGQRLGARDPEGATRGGWRAMRLAIGVMLVFGACITAAARPLATFLIDDREVVRLTVAFIYVLGSVQALMAIEFSLAGALRGAGDTRFPFVTVLVGLFGVRLTLAALFAWRGLRVEWVFAALIADYVVKATMFTMRFRSGRWASVIREQEVDELAM